MAYRIFEPPPPESQSLSAEERAGFLVAPPQNDRLMNSADLYHLAERTGFGIDQGFLRQFDGMTRYQAVNQLLDQIGFEPFGVEPEWLTQPTPYYWRSHRLEESERQVFRQARKREMAELRGSWIAEIAATPSPFTERLVLFWHDHFVTSFEKVRWPHVLARQLQTLRRYGSGNFRTLLRMMIRDPALIAYLDNNESRKRRVNENFGREFLELFTLGDGQYGQDDVVAASKALSGYSLRSARGFRFDFAQWAADEQEKRFLGQTIIDGDDLVDAVLDRPEAARFIVEKFWRHFVSETSLDRDVIDRTAQAFRASDYDIKTALAALLMSDAFWDPANRGSIVKAPIDLILGTVRRMAGTAPVPVILEILGDLDQLPFGQPNVGGWPEGVEWLTPASIAAREKQLIRLQDSLKMDVQTAGNNSRLSLELAGTDHEGPPQYGIRLRAAGAWSFDEVRQGSVKFSRNIERYGWPADINQGLVWQWIDVPDENLPKKLDAVRVYFDNDHASDTGDRNLWVRSMRLDGRELGAHEAVTRSCRDTEPEPGALYCNGYVEFTIPEPTDREANLVQATADQVLVNGIWVDWANQFKPDDRWQEIAVTLDRPRQQGRTWRNITLRLVAAQRFGGLAVMFSTRDCTPDCFSAWPDNSDIDEATGEKSIFIASDPDVPSASNSLDRLSEMDRRLVGSIMASLELIVEKVANDPAFPKPEKRSDWVNYLKRTAPTLSADFGNFEPLAIVAQQTNQGMDAGMMMGGSQRWLQTPDAMAIAHEQDLATLFLAVDPTISETNQRDPWAFILDPAYQLK